MQRIRRRTSIVDELDKRDHTELRPVVIAYQIRLNIASGFLFGRRFCRWALLGVSMTPVTA